MGKGNESDGTSEKGVVRSRLRGAAHSDNCGNGATQLYSLASTLLTRATVGRGEIDCICSLRTYLTVCVHVVQSTGTYDEGGPPSPPPSPRNRTASLKSTTGLRFPHPTPSFPAPHAFVDIARHLPQELGAPPAPHHRPLPPSHRHSSASARTN